MQTNLSPEYARTPAGKDAEAIIRKCVHCGFCTATCPTYQLLGDELDSPRGRIYQIKQVLEGDEPTRQTQLHLDRCLTCRNCETTCPSGVAYGRLINIGREVVAAKVRRPWLERGLRRVLANTLTSPLFALALRMGQATRGLLPKAVQSKVPIRQNTGAWPTREHPRKVLLLAGCVQPAMMPNINAATARVLDAGGIQILIAPKAGCCGALKLHLDDEAAALQEMRCNIDAWWPFVEGADTVEAIVSNASGCGVLIAEYAQHLAHDPAYAQKAVRINSLHKDLSVFLPELVRTLSRKVLLHLKTPPRLAYHPPCTLQHGQKLPDTVLSNLRALGFTVQVAASESAMCCGSAGAYSILQPELSNALRDRKLAHLQTADVQTIVSANIGCIAHLQNASKVPVRHWVEVLDAYLNLQDARVDAPLQAQ